MDDAELISVLEDAGLSPYQAEAYVTLLALGTASATDVAEACDVPDPRIYDVLRDLESKGYVETYQQDSLTARATDPDAVLDDLRSRSSEYLDAADAIEDRWNQPAVADHEVSIVKRFETVLSRAEEVIDDAELQIQVCANRRHFEALEDALADAYGRGVSVNLSLCTGEEGGPIADDRFEGVCSEVRHATIPLPFLVVVDRRWTCFAPNHRSVNEYGVVVNDRTYTFVFHWFFLGCLWEIWDAAYVEQSDDGRTEYVDVGQCLRDVVPLLEEGATVEAEVVGYDTHTNDSTTLSGRIVDATFPGDTLSTDGDMPVSLLPGPVGLVFETDEGRVEVGGWGATLEDVEATAITVTDVRYD